jgi:hypothetical protein
MSPTFTLHHKTTDIFARQQICKAPFFFPKAPSFKLSPFSLSPLISYPMPVDDVDGLIDGRRHFFHQISRTLQLQA